ncbi:hypothetical protein AVEN_184522-1 [Araneus ventricosus]|uniref:Uncharacterized protein n=1 Tax=Araneus ventricosus TaxID=182803 RepID=A0A4Y2PMQ5_ARAVE|nr:hypothetical protein AVEN_8980-1 [Araneus ventricosus]GBN52012.1 hypothetical protein AVEN_184522-1 [Araneus ventricosus]
MVANFLLVDGYLGIDNAKDLGLAYAQAKADSAKVSMNSDPRSKFLALVVGFVNLSDSLGLFTKEKAPFFAYHFANECFMAAVNYRWF